MLRCALIDSDTSLPGKFNYLSEREITEPLLKLNHYLYIE